MDAFYESLAFLGSETDHADKRKLKMQYVLVHMFRSDPSNRTTKTCQHWPRLGRVGKGGLERLS